MLYNFKEDTKVYVVYGGQKYTLDVYSDLTFSQTFSETAVPVKTLHAQYDMFENAVITKANPANFSFTSPILYDRDLDILLNLLMDYDPNASEATLKTADLYFEANSEIYKIEKCAIESGTFQLTEESVLSLNLSGTGRQLTKFIGTIPGTAVARSATRNFGRITAFTVLINGVEQSAIVSASVELKNAVTWIDFTTLQNSQLVSASTAVMLPEAFVVGSRTLSGMITQHVTSDSNSLVNTRNTAVPITIIAGEKGKIPILQFVIPAAVYTNRLDIQEIYQQGFDFRMVSNPASLSTVIIK